MNKLSKNKITSLKLFALMASVSTIAIAGVASAQEVSVGEQSETVVVKGVRGSQLRSVSAKKWRLRKLKQFLLKILANFQTLLLPILYNVYRVFKFVVMPVRVPP